MTDYARVLRLSPLLCANNTQPFALRHKTTKQDSALCYLSPSKNRNVSYLNRGVILQGECMSVVCVIVLTSVALGNLDYNGEIRT